MPRFRYVGPFAVVDVPLLNRELAHGDEFEVGTDLAEKFADQPDNFAPADKTSEV